MKREEMAAKMSDVARQHQEGEDSRRLVYDMIQYVKSLKGEGQKDLRDFLFESVTNEDSNWRLALEVLVGDPTPDTAPRLKAILNSREGSSLWRHSVILGLLELGEQTGKDLYLAYIRLGLEQRRDGARVLLAALCNIDPGSSVSMASEHFAQVLTSDKAGTEVRGVIAEFIRYYLRKDPNLLPALVRETILVNTRAGKRLRSLIATDLTNPAIVSEFEPRSVEKVLISVLSY